MERIGIVASKIAKGNIFLYNFYVLLIVILFALPIYIICGAVIVIAIIAVARAHSRLGLPANFNGEWMPLVTICLACLGVLIALVAAYAILRNVKLQRRK